MGRDGRGVEGNPSTHASRQVDCVVGHFVRKLSRELNRVHCGISDEAVRALMAYTPARQRPGTEKCPRIYRKMDQLDIPKNPQRELAGV